MSALGQRLLERRVVICAGAGGVGKTTVSAAIALGLAARGRRVAVVTIDPARRLAEALGLDRLGNEPQRVDPALLAGEGPPIEGQLWAMMLDVKRTFDQLIERLAPDPRAGEQILANPIYRHLSGAIAGSQEYTAIAKLYELARSGEWDAIVLDTPPSRNAIDFLDAPGRLTRFLDDRALRMLIAPPRHMARLAGLAFGALRSITGVALFADLTSFFLLLRDVLDGFRQRAAEVGQLLGDPATGFVIVTTSERAPLDEALYFAERLERSGMRRCGVVLNRAHPLDREQAGIERTAARLAPGLGAELARKVAAAHADVQVLARRDAEALERLERELGGGEQAPRPIADREADLGDMRTLLQLQRELLD